MNPESGTTLYTYDSASGCTGTSNGDLIKRTDAVGNVICYAYDSLHRATSITYSGPYASNTPNKYFVYDAATVNGTAMVNTKGRLAEAYTATCQTCTKITDIGYSYSPVGKITDIYESTPHSGGYYHLSSTYWANGNLNTLSGFPGLPTLTYGVDGEGRGYSVSASSGQNPVLSTLYNSADKPTYVTFGSNDSDQFTYDTNTGRVTQYQFTVNGQSETGSLVWNANHSLQSVSITDPFNSNNSQTCQYAFDDLRRVSSAICGSAWGQTFSYDTFGNITKNGSGSFQPTYSSATNRMAALPGFTPSYDANGNLLNDSFHVYAWDADGHPVSIDSVGLTYDALGRMVEQNRSGAYTQIVYSPNGRKLALMNGQALQKAFVPLPSGAKAVYTASGLSYYRHPDWLGSSRLASTASQTVYGDVAYAPFGESYSQSGNTDLSFTGQNQDTVTGLYDFATREFSPSEGRWISPDPAGIASVRKKDPRTWNRYAYALNDPLGRIDPNGECSEPAGLQPGQIGVCIDLYISAATIGGAPNLLVGVGDNRGPVSDDPSATFRVEYQAVYDPQSQTIDIFAEPGVSQLQWNASVMTGDMTTDPAWLSLSSGGWMASNISAFLSDGSASFTIDSTAYNGFSYLPDSPAPILFQGSFTLSDNGDISWDVARSSYPSIEGYTYQNGQTNQFLNTPETDPSNLGTFDQILSGSTVTVTESIDSNLFDWGGGWGDYFAGCPGVNMYVRSDLKADQVALGQSLTCLDPTSNRDDLLGARTLACEVQWTQESVQPSLYLKTANGAEVVLSLSTPIPVWEKLGRGDSFVKDLSSQSIGLHLLTDVGHGLEWSPIVEVKDLGLQPVVRLFVGGNNFRSGAVPGKYIYSHNDEMAAFK
jgi:RHS repeat-associated protein